MRGVRGGIPGLAVRSGVAIPPDIPGEPVGVNTSKAICCATPSLVSWATIVGGVAGIAGLINMLGAAALIYGKRVAAVKAVLLWVNSNDWVPSSSTLGYLAPGVTTIDHSDLYIVKAAIGRRSP